MEATTTRASTVMRSMPTSETRTQASITMPLSSTRSSTSMRLVPPTVRSTGIAHLLSTVGATRVPPDASGGGGRGRPLAQGLDAPLQHADLAPELLVLGVELSALAPAEVGIAPPPVHPDLLRLVDGADDEPDADGEQLDLGQGDADVSRHQQALVVHAVQHLHEAGGGAVLVERQVRSHAGLPDRTALVKSAAGTSQKLHQVSAAYEAACAGP